MVAHNISLLIGIPKNSLGTPREFLNLEDDANPEAALQPKERIMMLILILD